MVLAAALSAVTLPAAALRALPAVAGVELIPL
jgi:hypothetical protein